VSGQVLFSTDLINTLEKEWFALSVNKPLDSSAWQSRFEELRLEYHRIRASGGWLRGPSDLFGVVGLARSELAHSAVIAWLLDPEGRHRMGRAFLDNLVTENLPGLDPHTFDVRAIEREVIRFETIADIVVFGDTATIVIEAKVDAAEGVRQCDRIYERFSMDPGARFLFLTPTGYPPFTATDDAHQAFLTLSFGDIARALERAIDGTPHSGALDVARNYLLTLREEFG
jgi:hypothetical protein